MKSKIVAVILIALAFIAQSAYARTDPLVNHENLPVVTISGKALTAEQVKQAIMVAGAAKTWTLSVQGDGSLLAILNMRNKHTVMVKIVYSAERYSITYLDSTNMNFGQDLGVTVIHPNYNRWVKNLIQEINNELRRN
jgi:hypothetical protein